MGFVASTTSSGRLIRLAGLQFQSLDDCLCDRHININHDFYGAAFRPAHVKCLRRTFAEPLAVARVVRIAESNEAVDHRRPVKYAYTVLLAPGAAATDAVG